MYIYLHRIIALYLIANIFACTYTNLYVHIFAKSYCAVFAALPNSQQGGQSAICSRDLGESSTQWGPGSQNRVVGEWNGLELVILCFCLSIDFLFVMGRSQ